MYGIFCIGMNEIEEDHTMEEAEVWEDMSLV